MNWQEAVHTFAAGDTVQGFSDLGSHFHHRQEQIEGGGVVGLLEGGVHSAVISITKVTAHCGSYCSIVKVFFVFTIVAILPTISGWIIWKLCETRHRRDIQECKKSTIILGTGGEWDRRARGAVWRTERWCHQHWAGTGTATERPGCCGRLAQTRSSAGAWLSRRTAGAGEQGDRWMLPMHRWWWD